MIEQHVEHALDLLELAVHHIRLAVHRLEFAVRHIGLAVHVAGAFLNERKIVPGVIVERDETAKFSLFGFF